MSAKSPKSAKRAKKAGGGKLARSETVTVRLDPKLRYLAELAARKHRRTLSSYIEWAIEESLNSIILKRNEDYEWSLAEESSELWDVDEADRFAKLAQKYPDLLTHEEQLILKLVKENKSFLCFDGDINYSYLRENWEAVRQFINGEITREDFDAELTIPF